jgi:thymidine phosphorylase
MREQRLLEVTLALAVRMLRLGGLAQDDAEAERRVQQALSSGTAAECFARMVAGLGGPADVLSAGGAKLPQAPVQRAVPAPRSGVLVAMDTRALGLAVVALGSGRRRASDAVDPRVGFDAVLSLGSAVRAGEPLAIVHAASADAADAAIAAALAAVRIDDSAGPIGPAVVERITGA